MVLGLQRLFRPQGLASECAANTSRREIDAPASLAVLVAHEARITVAGPNCAGVIDLLDPEAPSAGTLLRELPRGGSAALISQSGAIAEDVIAKSPRALPRVARSARVSSGRRAR